MFVPSLVTPMAPPPVPVLSAMLLATVNVLPVAVVVSKAIVDPACRPLLFTAPPKPPRLVSTVVTSAAANPLVPAESTFSASVPPLATTILAAVQLAVVSLYSDVVLANCNVPALTVVTPA